MENLRKYVASGNVRASAMVYVRTNESKYVDGMRCFERDMKLLGAPKKYLVFETNATKTEALRPYTGSVWFGNDMPPKVKREILPLILSRRSMPTKNSQGMHVYNNPLFRLVVSMGCWGNPGCDYDPYTDSTNIIGNRTRQGKRNEEYIRCLRRLGFDVSLTSILYDLVEKETRAKKSMSNMEYLKKAMKKGGFSESAKAYTDKIRKAKKNLQSLEKEISSVLKEILED